MPFSWNLVLWMSRSHQPQRAAFLVVDQRKLARAWQFVMPPFTLDVPESRSEHHAEQQRTVVLHVLWQAGMEVLGFRHHGIETRAHVEFASVRADEREID